MAASIVVFGFVGRDAIVLRDRLGFWEVLARIVAKTIAAWAAANLSVGAHDASARIVDTLAFGAGLAVLAAHQSARIVLALTSGTYLALRAAESSARIGFTRAALAGLIGRTRDFGARADACAIFADLISGACDARTWVLDALGIAADLIGRTSKFGIVAIVFDANTVFADMFCRTLDVVARIDANAVSTNLAFAFALLLDICARRRTDTNPLTVDILAFLTARTLVEAGFATSAVVTDATACAGGHALVDLAVAIIVLAVADFRRGITRRTDRPIARCARADALATRRFARLGDRLLGARDVVDVSITIVVDAVADLRAGRFGDDRNIRHIRSDLGIEGIHLHFDLDPRVIGCIGFLAILNRLAPRSRCQRSLRIGCTSAHRDGCPLGRSTIPRDRFPRRYASCRMGGPPIAFAGFGDALELKARHIGISVRAFPVGGIFAHQLDGLGVDF